MTFRAVSRLPVYMQVADQIRDAIYSGELAAGQPLATERELAEMMGASRASIREALRLLQSEGIISGDTPYRRIVRGAQDGHSSKVPLRMAVRAGDADLAAKLIDRHISDFYREAVQRREHEPHSDRWTDRLMV